MMASYCPSQCTRIFLDKKKVFEALEMVLFFKLGVRPRSWSEPNSDWIEEIETPSLRCTDHFLFIYLFIFCTWCDVFGIFEIERD